MGVGDVTAILGIDAAWTPHHPSGVALVARDAQRWRCVKVAPSYRAFLDAADGRAVEWDSDVVVDGPPDPHALLDASRRLLRGMEVAVVTIDMPIATKRVEARRCADRRISREFGAAWCSTHSPTPTRPGEIGRLLTDGFVSAGYPVAVAGVAPAQRALVEVYPHPALLALTGATQRLPYKLGKAGRTWATVRPEWEKILGALRTRIDGIELALPASAPMSKLKRWEDAIDALVCAWVGIEYVEGRARAFGDDTAAIWCPTGPASAPLSG